MKAEGRTASAARVPVVAGDFNGDHQADVAWGSGVSDAVSVFTRNAGPSFSQEGADITTVGHKTGLATADFNGDGRLDIASANSGGGPVSILLLNATTPGSRVESQPPAGGLPLRLVAGDFNRDGQATSP